MLIINDRGISLKKFWNPGLRLHGKELLVRILMLLQVGKGLGLGLVGKRGQFIPPLSSRMKKRLAVRFQKKIFVLTEASLRRRLQVLVDWIEQLVSVSRRNPDLLSYALRLILTTGTEKEGKWINLRLKQLTHLFNLSLCWLCLCFFNFANFSMHCCENIIK